MAETAKKPNIFQRWARSFKDMRGEMKKVVWPTKKQVINNTLIVLAVVIVFRYRYLRPGRPVLARDPAAHQVILLVNGKKTHTIPTGREQNG